MAIFDIGIRVLSARKYTSQSGSLFAMSKIIDTNVTPVYRQVRRHALMSLPHSEGTAMTKVDYVNQNTPADLDELRHAASEVAAMIFVLWLVTIAAWWLWAGRV